MIKISAQTDFIFVLQLSQTIYLNFLVILTIDKQ